MFVSLSLTYTPLPLSLTLKTRTLCGWLVSNGLPRQWAGCSILLHGHRPMRTEVTEGKDWKCRSWQSKRLLHPSRQHHVILDLCSMSTGTRLWARTPARDSQRADLPFSRQERFQARELSLASSFLFLCLFFPSLSFLAQPENGLGSLWSSEVLEGHRYKQETPQLRQVGQGRVLGVFAGSHPVFLV